MKQEVETVNKQDRCIIYQVDRLKQRQSTFSFIGCNPMC